MEPGYPGYESTTNTIGDALKTKAIILFSLTLVLLAGLMLMGKKEAWTDGDVDWPIVDVTQYTHGESIFISPQALHEQLNDENLIILDGNHPRVYSKNHIPGAINIGFKGFSACDGKPGERGWGTILNKGALTKKLESLGIDNNTLVVAYSDIFKGPGAGGRAVWQMKMAGFENVRLLYGGLNVWRRSGYAVSKEVIPPTPATGLVLKEYDGSLNASMDFVRENINTLKIVDVRSLKEFTGKDTSRGEARGGHIQGAEWLEWKALLNDDSTPKPPEEITRLMAQIGITPEDDFILY